MNEEEMVVVPQTTEEELEVNIEEEAEPISADETQEESVEELREKLAKANELAKNYKIRAEKAENRPKKGNVEANKAQDGDNNSKSIKDTLALIENKVTAEEDIELVQKFATFEKKTIAEALKSPVLKGLLGEANEKRLTAQATNVTGQRKSSIQVSDDVLLNNARSGKFAESDADIERTVSAYLKNK